MLINFNCTNCGKTLKAKDEFVGRKIKCPKCSTVISVGNSNSRNEKNEKPSVNNECPSTEISFPITIDGLSLENDECFLIAKIVRFASNVKMGKTVWGARIVKSLDASKGKVLLTTHRIIYVKEFDNVAAHGITASIEHAFSEKKELESVHYLSDIASVAFIPSMAKADSQLIFTLNDKNRFLVYCDPKTVSQWIDTIDHSLHAFHSHRLRETDENRWKSFQSKNDDGTKIKKSLGILKRIQSEFLTSGSQKMEKEEHRSRIFAIIGSVFAIAVFVILVIFLRNIGLL